MKLKCRVAYEKPSDGFLGIGAHGRKPIAGLTEGKEYEVALASDASGQQYTSTTFYFLVYNDNGEWETYDLDLFGPAE
jgi:hypothetical protein